MSLQGGTFVRCCQSARMPSIAKLQAFLAFSRWRDGVASTGIPGDEGAFRLLLRGPVLRNDLAGSVGEEIEIFSSAGSRRISSDVAFGGGAGSNSAA
jgi:hypothetical protein